MADETRTYSYPYYFNMRLCYAWVENLPTGVDMRVGLC